LLVGAGDTGETVLHEMLTRPELGYQPVGLIDDAPHKKQAIIHGVNILGTREQLQTIVKRYGAEEVIICMPTASREVIRDIFFRCQEIGVKCKTMPGVYQLINDTVSISQIREVGVGDILGREPVRIDMGKAADLIAGKSVLVTGASGSIGSELCRQIYNLQPASLIMVDQNESGLFQIEQELALRQGSTSAIPVVADVTNRKRVKAIFDKCRPSIVFHAAAYKHVPLMETCIIEAIDNNLFGTKTVAEIAIQFRAEKFVFISTDKAVEPISVMGTSKALTEKMVQALAPDSPTKFIIVRFGNVLDSSGSVVPTFRQQIARGGPVTVTHPEMARYFMTIPEAMQLVIQAAAMGRGGEIFVLNMGEQVPIVELARSMIKLSGFEPDKDIPIVFTGIRPGEKLCEKLFWGHEEIAYTKHKKILIAKNTRLDIAKFKKDIQQMEKAISSGETEKTQEILARMCTRHLSGTGTEKGINKK
jgi:FlaA1/EpsC-like NDP-sugar epimerase